jgi:2-isopropylmalate synthase
MGLSIDPDPEATADLLNLIKEREAGGFAYDGAPASFELLVRRRLGLVRDYFETLSFRVIDERRFNAAGELEMLSEATIKISVGGQHFYTVAEGNGPVNALDTALRSALAATYPTVHDMRLIDYKVRILAPKGTAAVTRVIIESGDEAGRVWQTVGVSGNIIDASYNALLDSISYKLLLDGAAAPAA